jgi:predicted nucleic acid-binding protein
MKDRPVVVYDANVLYPAQLRDLLIRVAVAGLVRAHWSDEIHEEWIQNVLADRPEIERAQLERARFLMEQALPAARVNGHLCHVAALELPDPDDRHVLAAALEAGAESVVTFNTRDFPRAVLEPLGISALHPDLFVRALVEAHPEALLQVLHTHRLSLRRPPKSPQEYLAMLERAGLVRTVVAVRIDVAAL